MNTYIVRYTALVEVLVDADTPGEAAEEGAPLIDMYDLRWDAEVEVADL